MNILIVDDEPMVRQSMARVIRQMDESYRVREAEDGEEAIRLLQCEEEDMIIADIRMPVVDGLQLTDYVRKKFPQTEVILLTGYAEFEYAVKALRYGVSDYLLKPIAKEVLIKMVRKVEQKKRLRESEERIQKLRADNVLEKRVQDLLYGIELPHYDKELLPDFQLIHLFTVTSEDEEQWECSVRFAIQNVFKEALAEAGTSVGILENHRVTFVRFLEDNQLRTELIEKTIRTLEDLFHIRLRVGDGGYSRKLSDIGLMYLRSLNELGLWEQENVQANDVTHPLIRTSLQMMQSGFAQDITLKMIADQLYVNPNYLSSLFKKETGLTFSQHMIRIRMEEAMRLLKQTTLKIYEICHQIGYADQAHFSRMFKSITGLTPNEYRQENT